MEKTKVAIIGPGNAGSDLMYKVLRSRRLEMALMAGIVESEGIKRARGMGVATSIDSVYGVLRSEGIRIAFDTSGAKQHPKHATILRKAGIIAIDLTPAAVGHFIAPGSNIEQAAGQPNVSMATCAAQAAIPVLRRVGGVCGIKHAEVVACLSSYSADPGSRESISRYTETTARAMVQVGGAHSAKAIAIFNPAQPPLTMTNTIYMRLADRPDPDAIASALEVEVELMQPWVPGYALRGQPKLHEDWLEVCVQIEDKGPYLPIYPGNLHMLNAAAVKTAEYIAELFIA